MSSHSLHKKKNRIGVNENIGLKKRHFYPLNHNELSKEFEGKVYSSPNLSFKFNRSNEIHYQLNKLSKKLSHTIFDEDESFSVLNDSYTQINSSLERIVSKMLNIANAEAASLSLIKPIETSSLNNFSTSNLSLSNNIYGEVNSKIDHPINKAFKLELTTFINRNEHNKKERRKSENKTYKMYRNVKVKKIEKDISVDLSEIQYFCCEVVQRNKVIIENNSEIINKRSWLDLNGNVRSIENNNKRYISSINLFQDLDPNNYDEKNSLFKSGYSIENVENGESSYEDPELTYKKKYSYKSDYSLDNLKEIESGTDSHIRNFIGIPISCCVDRKLVPWMQNKCYNNNVIGVVCLYNKYNPIHNIDNCINDSNENMSSLNTLSDSNSSINKKKGNIKVFTNNDYEKLKVYLKLLGSAIQNNYLYSSYNLCKNEINNRYKKFIQYEKEIEEEVKDDSDLVSIIDNMGKETTKINDSDETNEQPKNSITKDEILDDDGKAIMNGDSIECLIQKTQKNVTSSILKNEIENKLIDLKKENLYYREAQKELIEKMKEMSNKNDVLTDQVSRHSIILQLVNILQSLFGELDYYTLLRKIVSSAQELVGSDQASLYMVQDNDTFRYVNFDSEDDNKYEDIPISKGGLIGHVIQTGELLNIGDAYLDKNYNGTIDTDHKYRTKSIIVVPIFRSTQIVNGGNETNFFSNYNGGFYIPDPTENDKEDAKKVISVLKLVNKLGEDGEVIEFSDYDVMVIQFFAAYCAISMERAILLERNQKQKMLMDVNVEMIAYHMTTSVEDVDHFYEKYLKDESKTFINPEIYQNWDFDTHSLKDQNEELILTIYSMFQEFNFTETFQIPEKMLVHFLMTVHKNYRTNVQYHNFSHASAVTHTLYLLLKFGGLRELINDQFDILVMLVSCICHDIDHRGTNNQFQVSAKTMLAVESSDSTMERHHFNHTINILSLPDHNIFKNLSKENYKRALNIMESCIISTDLSIFFKNLKSINELGDRYINGENLDLENNKRNLELLHGIVMTSCDLGSMFKPFEETRLIAEDVLIESFEQGKKEKELGLQFTSALVDRASTEKEIPKVQYEFFSNVIEPAAKALVKFLPKAKYILEGVQRNKECWRQLMEKKIEYAIGSYTHTS
ncbi:hypothetical protein H8356DRAFT_1058260 [Neocallimastix lanati (nom. inval.)]|jgi:hypothetical protein|uniref:Phosphodiesterase n=1 Tax=Neocallimastix californiae TaxID=1754190 RepID=A0A1Y2AIE9_9FUNG|nr:hypothetical protein H8356DRAFT_1058260 [Neocallimastix sp. JGI-2020a]ORY22296.1 hypothetical protein LY90DRAFT_675945 [Neocallimastix californiae]|eukprot:ORY22296.1 hypothetical protein LY90DRAFT_675945 [Neocallimastix californiae]